MIENDNPSQNEVTTPDVRNVVGVVGNLVVTEPVYSPEALDEVMRFRARKRVKFTEGLDHDESMIDTKRVANFMSGYGLGMKPFIVIDKSTIPKLNKMVGSNYEVDGLGGLYLPMADLAIAVSDAEKEAKNPGITEAVLVHELAHANHNDTLFGEFVSSIGPPYDADTVRGGFGVTKFHGTGLAKGYEQLGSFYEEGFADLMRTRYISEALGLEKGFVPQDNMTFDLDGSVFIIPDRYFYNGKNEEVTQKPPAIAAYGMELLIAKDPKIFDAMLRSRDEPEGLRELARRVNALKPGLYRELQKLQYLGGWAEASDFLLGVQIILDELYEGDQRIANKVVDGLDQAA